MARDFKVIKSNGGQWFYSYIGIEGLVNVGWWETKEEATKAAQAQLQQFDRTDAAVR